jgi:hypothetical protein
MQSGIYVVLRMRTLRKAPKSIVAPKKKVHVPTVVVPRKKSIEVHHPVSEDAKNILRMGECWMARITVEGTRDLLMHRYSHESVEAKKKEKKNSEAKKTDDVDSYVYRVSNKDHRIGMPGTWLHGALIKAGRSQQDPRSPRKMACDLMAEGIIINTLVAPFEPDVTEADYLDTQRVVVNRGSAVPRTRPAMNPGWRATLELAVLLPEYITRSFLQEMLAYAGRICGVGDYRKGGYGRFAIVSFDVL